MGVRNCKEIGENLQRIMNRLMANDDLVKLLYYTDKDPLAQPVLTATEKREKVFNNLISIIPRVPTRINSQSIAVIRVDSGTRLGGNNEFREIIIPIEVFVPLESFLIMDSNLRPFAILGEIQKSLEDKQINGLGRITGGDFDFKFVTDEFACYEIEFAITTYD